MDSAIAMTYGVQEIAFEAFGVPVTVQAPSPEIMARVELILPPGWQRREAIEDGPRFVLRSHDGVTYIVEYPGEVVAGSDDLDVALEVLDAKLRMHIASEAPEYVFVHAGVVGHRDRAIVIPGYSFSGKTTLVAELVRGGATYYSDEYAVLDADGLVHPYAKPLSIRTVGRDSIDHPVQTLGGTAGDEPLPIGLVVAAVYSPDGQWDPRRLSAAEGILALLANTIPAQDRPEQSLQALRRAVDGAVVLEGERGEASAIVDQLLGSVPA
jgi:hypothetical protein